MRRRFIDEVDRLVGQEAVADVPVRETGRRHQRRVRDSDAVMNLVALLEPPEDGDRLLEGRLTDEHRLETPLERRVFLDVLSVFVQRRCADHSELATGQRRLQHVAGVHRPLGRTGTHHGVKLIQEQHVLPTGLGDLLEGGLQALLELTSVFGSGQHRGDVELDEALVPQRLRHIPGYHPLGQPLHDRRLPDSRITDEHRVVLRAA